MKTINARSLFKLDWLILAIIALLCFIAFQQGDMYHTVGSSFAYLKGHFFDFYDYNKQHIGGNNYLPSSYILFAIWNIPLKILGLVNLPTTEISLVIIWWNKLLTTLFYVFSGILVYKIGKSVGFSETNSKLTAFIWLTTPIALFSQFIFGQYDVFTLFFTLLGLYYYLEKNNIKFIIFFGVAMTFKYFPMFIFMPLLLAREKDVWKIIKDSCLVVLPVAIEILIYYPSAAFQTGVLGFGAPKFILQTQLGGQYASIQLVVLLWMLLCAYAYFNQIEDRNNFISIP